MGVGKSRFHFLDGFIYYWRNFLQPMMKRIIPSLIFVSTAFINASCFLVKHAWKYDSVEKVLINGSYVSLPSFFSCDELDSNNLREIFSEYGRAGISLIQDYCDGSEMLKTYSEKIDESEVQFMLVQNELTPENMQSKMTTFQQGEGANCAMLNSLEVFVGRNMNLLVYLTPECFQRIKTPFQQFNAATYAKWNEALKSNVPLAIFFKDYSSQQAALSTNKEKDQKALLSLIDEFASLFGDCWGNYFDEDEIDARNQAIEACRNTKFLDLSEYPKLERIPGSLALLANVEILNVSNSPVFWDLSEIAIFKKLHKLSIRNNPNLKLLPASVFWELNNLKSVALIGSSINFLDVSSVKALANVKELSVDLSQLQGINALTNLEVLSVWPKDNNTREDSDHYEKNVIYNDIRFPPNIRILDLSALNNLKKIGNWIHFLPKLQKLILSRDSNLCYSDDEFWIQIKDLVRDSVLIKGSDTDFTFITKKVLEENPYSRKHDGPLLY